MLSMSQSISEAKLGRTSTTLLLPIIFALGVSVWLFQRAGVTQDNPTPASVESEERATPQGANAEPSATLHELASPESETRGSVEVVETSDELQVTAEHPLRGRIVPDRALPADESLQVVLEMRKRKSDGDGSAMPWESLAAFSGQEIWTEVSRVFPDPNGRFEVPRPVDAIKIRLRIEGDYIAWGAFQFEVDGKEDPGKSEFEVPVGIGAHVTLQLALNGIATVQEIAALEGDVFHIDSMGSAQSGFSSGRSHQKQSEIGSGGKATFRGLAAWSWGLGRDGANSKHQDLAPFRVAPNFKFEPSPGERVVIEVPMERGQVLDGAVVDTSGRAIAGAGINIGWHWRTASDRGDSWDGRRADDEGRFRFQALPLELDSLTISLLGFFDVQLGAAELAKLLASKGPHEFTLQRGGVLQVSITDGRGLPAHGFQLLLRKEGSTQSLSGATTDDEGLANFIGLPEGPLVISGVGRLRKDLQNEPELRSRFISEQSSPWGRIQGTDPEVETLWCLLASVPARQVDSGEELKLHVRPVPMVHGVVTGADPAWPDPIRLSVHKPDPNRPSFMGDSGMTQPGKGTFEVNPQTGAFSGSLPPGKYAAIGVSGQRANGRITAASPKVHSTRKVEFEVGTEDVHIVVPFEQASGIGGTVRFTDGTDLAGITVRMSRKEGWFTSPVGSVLTDAQGRFQFDSQQQGTYFLRLEAARYTLATHPEINLQAGDTPDPLELVAIQTGAVRVRMTALDGSEKANPTISIFNQKGTRSWTRPIEGDPEWNGAHGPLVPGSYVLSVFQEIQSGPPLVHRRSITIEPGKITEAAFKEVGQSEATISGRVTAGGEPVEGLNVWILDGNGVAASSATDKDGSYLLGSLSIGPMRLTCGSSVSTPIETREVEIASGQNSMLPISIPAGGIDGHLEGNAMMAHPVAFQAGSASEARPFRWCGGTSNGNFHIPYLPDGLYEVTTVDRTGKRSPGSTVLTVEVKNGETTRGIEIVFTSVKK
jgi:hypothetical protein